MSSPVSSSSSLLKDQWKYNGVRIVTSKETDPNTAQTMGMLRAAAITAQQGANKLWAVYYDHFTITSYFGNHIDCVE
jgi:hypothetical protein